MDPAKIARCGFCKLEGDELDFVSKRYEVTFGRKSRTTPLDVVLGECQALLPVCGMWFLLCPPCEVVALAEKTMLCSPVQARGLSSSELNLGWVLAAAEYVCLQVTT